MAQVQAAYLKQFTALDTLLSSLQTTSSYLTQQIDNLPSLSPRNNEPPFRDPGASSSERRRVKSV